MPDYFFKVYETSSNYYDFGNGTILSETTLQITDSPDALLHRTQAEDTGNDQTFAFFGEPVVTDYVVQYLDFAQVNGGGPEYELYAMRVQFAGGGVKDYVLSKDTNFEPNVGDSLGITTFSSFTTADYGTLGAAVCFAAGTRILASPGYLPVEVLRPGDKVQTLDSGLSEILWIGCRQVGLSDLTRSPGLRPVVIKPGLLGNSELLCLSQQHRVMLDAAVSPMRGEAFVTARQLARCCPKTARIAHGKRHVTYYHLLLDRHEVLMANGAPCESLFPGEVALKGISPADLANFRALLPGGEAGRYCLARPSLKGAEASSVFARIGSAKPSRKMRMKRVVAPPFSPSSTSDSGRFQLATTN